MSPAAGFQYLSTEGASDDDPSIGAGFPCASSQPQQPNGSIGMQVVANPADSPGKRAIELWSAVALPFGSSTSIDVYFDVFYPDGNFKARIKADTAVACTSLGSSADGSAPTSGSVFAAALDTGQVDAIAVDALVNRCIQGAGAFGSAELPLSVYEPCGPYRVETLALTPDVVSTTTSFFQVRCMQYVTIDATAVNWGELVPGSPGTITGDWSTATPNALTVQNLGSGGASIGVRFAPMVSTDNPSSTITQFGASFGRDSSLMSDFPGIAANTDTWFLGSPDAVLCTNDVARVDLTALPAKGVTPGTYAGTLTILSRNAGSNSPCNNDNGILGSVPPGSTGAIDNQRAAPATAPAPPLPAPPTTTTTEPPTTTTEPTTTTTSGSTTTAPATTTTTAGSTTTAPATTTTTAGSTTTAPATTTTTAGSTTTAPATTTTTAGSTTTAPATTTTTAGSTTTAPATTTTTAGSTTTAPATTTTTTAPTLPS